jgi:hypothetical protein
MDAATIIDPADYRVRVRGLPRITSGRYIDVQLTVFSTDDEEVGIINEFFDIKQPKKLINFFQAIGLPYAETEPFNIMPSRWRGKECDVLVLLKEWQNEKGQTHQRNILLDFTPC